MRGNSLSSTEQFTLTHLFDQKLNSQSNYGEKLFILQGKKISMGSSRVARLTDLFERMVAPDYQEYDLIQHKIHADSETEKKSNIAI
jgi:hypothetical protein